ncbi:hypothetical protein Bbelb_372820 [Branchiostoma belcheri]|nr:hypothetical protein Bbelb_372820 [Branchiostoma belcheri]
MRETVQKHPSIVDRATLQQIPHGTLVEFLVTILPPSEEEAGTAMRLKKLLPNLQARYNVAAHVRTCSGTTRNRTRVSQFYSPVMYHYTTRRHSKRIKWAQNGTRPDCPEPYPEALSIIKCVRSGTVLDSPPRVSECRFSPRTVWDTRRVSQTVLGHGLGQGTRVSQTVLSPQARLGTRAECPRPCPSMVWDKDFVYLQVDLLYSVVDTRQDYPDPCVGLVDKQVLFPIPGLSLELCPVRHGSGQSPRVPNCAQTPVTVWDTRRVSQTMPSKKILTSVQDIVRESAGCLPETDQTDARPTPEPDRDRPGLHPRRAPAQLGPKHNQSFGRLGGDFLPEHLLSQQASYSTDLSPVGCPVSADFLHYGEFSVVCKKPPQARGSTGLGELHRLWRDHVGIRPRYAGRGASASRSLTSDINNTPPCVLSSNSNKCSSSVLCSDTVSQVCVARGPDVRNVSYPNRALGGSV